MPLISKTGLLLLGHGSRDPHWREPMNKMQQALQKQKPDLAIQCAYLELCEPSLEDAAAILLQQDSKLGKIVIYPVFIGMGTHTKEDLPHLKDKLAHQYPNVQWSLAPALGTDERLIDLVAAITKEWTE
ncbi:cobalamin biosynthesis protein CbiX [Lampropedia puyangensis]|uniref:Cobalamin biosynthesis protein CbiX n=1 Tax=Lampropedia puyangensis TaxID=1330072 RepID=A0A4S8FCB9_9BURK|nr:CbiX/SirB N-terminal domain-containing protein [Lampropedia puyangensis]THU04505.1 cobalamin biosynthesis protein CbiX [Lampropedia puyangensis]